MELGGNAEVVVTLGVVDTEVGGTAGVGALVGVVVGTRGRPIGRTRSGGAGPVPHPADMTTARPVATATTATTAARPVRTTIARPGPDPPPMARQSVASKTSEQPEMH